MESMRKMNWHSSAISLAASSITGSQGSNRSNYRTRDNQNHVQSPPDDVTEKLKTLSVAIDETLEENKASIKESSDFLKSLDLLPKSLSRETNEALDRIAAIVRAENLQSADETALTVSRERAKREALQKASIDRKLKRMYEDLCDKYAKLEEKVNNVQESVNCIAEFVDSAQDQNENEYSEVIHKATQLNAYREKAQLLDQQLMALNVANEFPDKILEKYRYYLGATGELAELNKILSQYGDLPADILQAKAAVEQKEKRRVEVKKLLDNRMIQ